MTWTGNINLATSTDDRGGRQPDGVRDIGGNSDLTKVGASTLFLQAAESYTGTRWSIVGNVTLNSMGQILNTSGVILECQPGRSRPFLP